MTHVAEGGELAVGEGVNSIEKLLMVVLSEAPSSDRNEIDLRTFLRPSQTRELRRGFAGLLSEFCGAVDANRAIAIAAAEQAGERVSALRNMISEGPVVTTQPPLQEVCVHEVLPSSDTVSEGINLPRKDSKEFVLLARIRSQGGMTLAQIQEWAHGSKEINTAGEDKKKINGRVSTMIYVMKRKNLVVSSGRGGIWDLSLEAEQSFRGHIDSCNHGGVAKVSKGLRPDSRIMKILKIVVAAGPDGVSTGKIKSAGIKDPTITLLHMENKMGLVYNKAPRGTGHRAIWVATDAGKKEVGLVSNDDKDQSDPGTKPRSRSGGKDASASDDDPLLEPHSFDEYDREPETRHRSTGPPKIFRIRATVLADHLPSIDLPKIIPRKQKRPSDIEEWDWIVLTFMNASAWKLTFEQLIRAAGMYGRYYGFDLSCVASDCVRRELTTSVLRLRDQGKLVVGLGGDTNLITPVGTTDNYVPVDRDMRPQQDCIEIRTSKDWQSAVLDVIELSDSPPTSSEIVEHLCGGILVSWCIPQETDVNSKVAAALRQLRANNLISRDDDAGEDEDGEIRWRA